METRLRASAEAQRKGSFLQSLRRYSAAEAPRREQRYHCTSGDLEQSPHHIWIVRFSEVNTQLTFKIVKMILSQQIRYPCRGKIDPDLRFLGSHFFIWWNTLIIKIGLVFADVNFSTETITIWTFDIFWSEVYCFPCWLLRIWYLSFTFAYFTGSPWHT